MKRDVRQALAALKYLEIQALAHQDARPYGAGIGPFASAYDAAYFRDEERELARQLVKDTAELVRKVLRASGEEDAEERR